MWDAKGVFTALDLFVPYLSGALSKNCESDHVRFFLSLEILLPMILTCLRSFISKGYQIVPWLINFCLLLHWKHVIHIQEQHKKSVIIKYFQIKKKKRSYSLLGYYSKLIVTKSTLLYHCLDACLSLYNDFLSLTTSLSFPV